MSDRAATVAVDREDLERIVSAATSFCAMMQLSPELGRGLLRIVAQPGQPERTVSVGAEMVDLAHAVKRVRTQLGWRRP